MFKFSKINITGFIVFLSFCVIHFSPIFDKEFVRYFSLRISESVLLLLLLSAIILKLVRNKRKLDSLFLYFIAIGFFSSLALSLFRIFFWQQISSANQSFLLNLNYFIFYSLTITAIEVKSFSTAKKFLDKKSFITSSSILLFLIGSFTFLVLESSNFSSKERIWGAYFFYTLMDSYLVLRWWHLSIQSDSSSKLGFFLLGLASLAWVFSDILEYFILLDETQIIPSWVSWVWYTPFFLFFIGIGLIDNVKTNKYRRGSFKRYHVLNSPLFFLGFMSFLLFIEFNYNPSDKVDVLQPIQIIWFSLTLALAIFQSIELFETNKRRKKKLKELQCINESLLDKLEYSSKNIEKQITANQMILDTISNPILTLSLNGQVISCNRATVKTLGYTEKELINKNFLELIPKGEELYRFFDYQSYRQQLLKNKKGLELESRIRTKNREDVLFHVTISKSMDVSRDMIILSLADISQQKHEEEQLHYMKDEFTANVSHELRTPLTIVNGVIESLLSTQTDEESIEQLLTAKRNNLRLIYMVDQLLDISRVASEKLPIVDIDVSEPVRMICQSYSIIANDRNLNYSFSICNPLIINGNQQAFENILYNLISNAFKYTNENGEIRIDISETNDKYMLVVSDTGIGISEQEQSKIFDRFQRSESDKHHSIPGVGIGLSLVKDLVDSMNWEIAVKSVLNKGSDFIITINKAVTSNVKAALLSNADQKERSVSVIETQLPNEPASSNISKSQYLVLIIEDNIDMQRYLEKTLQPYHQCLVASDGHQGLKLAEEYLPDIIISDIMMPGIDGFEVLSKLKQHSVTAHIPVIMLTAKSDKKSKLKGLKGEADDYLTKPFDSDELTLKVNNILKIRRDLQIKYEQQWSATSQTDSTNTMQIDNPFLLSVNDIFEKNYADQKFSTSQLASQLAMSERQLQRKVKALLDLSPLDLLKRFRLEKSKIQLSEGIQIGLVAQSCGFSSQTYFGRCFKEQYEMTPKAFQKKNP